MPLHHWNYSSPLMDVILSWGRVSLRLHLILFLLQALPLICATPVVSGKTPASSFLRIGGQMSPIFAHYSNGKTANMFGTLGSSNNRIHFLHQTGLSSGYAVRGVLELGFDLNSTVNADPWNVPKDRVDFRKAYLSLFSEKYGEIYIGKIKTATDDTAETDCCFGMLSIAPLLYGLRIKQPDGVTNGPFVSFYHNFDGAARAVGLRYDTPSFNGIGLRFDLHNDADPNENATRVVPGAAIVGNWILNNDGQLRFASGLTKYLSRLNTIDTSAYAWSNSASAMLPCGTGVTLSYSMLSYTRDNVFADKTHPRYWLVKLFQKFNLPNPVAVAVEYSTCRGLHPFVNLTHVYGKADVVGFFVAQSYPKTGIEAFFAVKRVSYSLDPSFKSDLKFEKTNIVILGMRVVF